MDRTICANESSRGRGFSASLRLHLLRRGRPSGGVRGMRRAGRPPRGRWFLRFVEEPDVILFHKNSGRVMPPEPPKRPSRAMSPWTRSAGAGSPDGARGPRGHRQPSAVASAPPPVSATRSSAARMSSPSAGSPNRGYSSPSGGRVRVLHAILRPRIPPNRPPNAQNRRESGLPGVRGAWAWTVATESAKAP